MSSGLAIPSDATRETLFRCEKWSCSLSFGACLSRQVALRRVATSGKKLPVFPFCAEECQVGRAVAARLGRKPTTVHTFNGAGKLQVYRPVPPAKEGRVQVLKRPCGVKGCPGRISDSNKSGLCSDCMRRKFSVGDQWRPSGRSGLARQGKAALDPTVLSDQDLAACVRELRARRDRIQREAEERVRQLDAALAELSGRAPEATGT